MDAPLNIVWSRPLPERAEPSTVTVSRDAAGRWFVFLLVEEEVAPLPPVAAMVGVDVGNHHPCDAVRPGRRSATPGTSRLTAGRLAKAQRRLARKVKGSSTRPRPDPSSPGSMPVSSTAGEIISIRSPRGLFTRTK